MKILRKRNENETFSEFFGNFPEYFLESVEKTVLIRKIVLFFGFKKPY